MKRQDGGIVLDWEWLLRANPAKLWPLVSDTNRMNRLARMAPVTFTEEPIAGGGIRRIGTSKMAGMTVRWDEHPFEWVFGVRFRVERTFINGPLRGYRSAVSLEKRDTGALLRHRIDLFPRNVIFAPIVAASRWGLFRNWDRAYRAVDALAAGDGPDPFGPNHAPGVPPKLRSMISAICADVDDPDLLMRLVKYVLGAADSDLLQIRPFALADAWGVPRTRMLDLCLVAAHRGLLEPRWSLVCPHCRGPKRTVERLEELEAGASCWSCNLDFDGRFDENVELSFRPAMNVRPVEGTVFCIGGPGATPHIVFQGDVAAGGRRELGLVVDVGTYRLRGPQMAGKAHIVFEGRTDDSTLDGVIPVVFLAKTGVEAPDSALDGDALEVVLLNEDADILAVVIEHVDAPNDALTAAYVHAVSRFKLLFDAEILGGGVELPVGLLAILAVEVAGAAHLYETLGDRDGRVLVNALLDLASAAVDQGGGAVFTRYGEGVMASFFDPLDCVRAALDLARRASADPATSEAIGLRIGADAGPCIAHSDNGRLEYYGATVNRANDAAAASSSGGLALSVALHAEPSVQLLLGESGDWEIASERKIVRLRLVSGTVAR